MRLVLLVLLWAVPLSAGTQLIAVAGEIAAPRFAEGDLDGDGAWSWSSVVGLVSFAR